VPKGESYSHSKNPEHTAFIYVIDGTGVVNGTGVADRTLILFDAGDQFSIEARESSLRFLLLTGRPLKEPIAWHGPILKNTQAELETAFREYQEGTFVER
jgi:redox-sensitive bicupin YhaK (pirin superfamily)